MCFDPRARRKGKTSDPVRKSGNGGFGGPACIPALRWFFPYLFSCGRTCVAGAVRKDGGGGDRRAADRLDDPARTAGADALLPACTGQLRVLSGSGRGGAGSESAGRGGRRYSGLSGRGTAGADLYLSRCGCADRAYAKGIPVLGKERMHFFPAGPENGRRPRAS